ncbi:MAG: hypothetical protein IKM20_08555 [Erysipelotrichales bacterium]|nr:hypothetical protein [Erysipelotrichales bacterium]
MKKKIKIIVCIIILLVTSFFSVIISANLTGVLNPISSIYNVSKVILDKDEMYVVAQNKPWKIMFSKAYKDGKSAQDILDEFMKNDGYEIYDRMGSIITYKNESGNERRIHFTVNKYYSLWEWI